MRLALALLLFSACEKQTMAGVECRIVGDAFNCEVKHVQGSKIVDVCWNIIVECGSAPKAHAHACQNDLRPLQAATKIVREAEFANIATCDNPSGIAVSDITVTTR